MILKGDSGIIEITILKRSNNNTEDYWDANWLESVIEINIPNFTACYKTNLRVDDLQRFYNSLLELKERTSNKVEFNTIEDGLSLDCSMKLNGNIVCSGKGISQLGDALEFKLETNMIFLNNLISELREALQEYPLVGSLDH